MPAEQSRARHWTERIGAALVPGLSLPLLRRMLPYARPYLGLELLLLATLLGAVGMDLLSPLLMGAIIDDAIIPGNRTLLNWLALGLFALSLSRGGVNSLQTYLSHRIGESVVNDLRRDLFVHLQRMSLHFFVNTSVGEIFSRMGDVSGARDIFTRTLVTIISNVITIIAALGVMFALEWRLTLMGLLLVPLFFLPARWAAQHSRRLTKQTHDETRVMSEITSQTLNVSGALLMKVFGRQAYEAQRFTEQSIKLSRVSVQQAVVWQLFTLGLTLLGAVGVALAYWFGGQMVIDKALTLGTVVVFTAYLWRVYGPISSLMDVPVNLASSLASLERLFETLDLPVEIVDRPDAHELVRAQGQIRFERVYFRYGSPPEGAQGADAERKWALEDVNLEIAPGQLAAFVGPSGSGKTTLTYLVPRLYDANAGAVCIDGWDVRDLKLASLNDQIGMVTQETYLFDDTIRANLLYARSHATDAELAAAIEAAYLTEVMARLPEGLDTVVGQRGYRMSGGERQRLSIARIVLKNPRILILDEATSALDTESELAVQVALERLFQDRTSLVIAHRLSTIRAADMIFVLDDGRIVEQGTHPQLLAKGGLYAQLYQKQFKDQERMLGIRPADMLAFPQPQREVLLALLRLNRATPQTLAAEMRRETGDILTVLGELEKEGLARALEDGRYELVLARARVPAGT
ncbi:MAG: ABC transporter ATP-binding protein [Chloroflexi bacterium]|nr:ABC transporter ATP-binding protein [Chloroflexota bacterium]